MEQGFDEIKNLPPFSPSVRKYGQLELPPYGTGLWGRANFGDELSAVAIADSPCP
jgi:hypothetical protein